MTMSKSPGACDVAGDPTLKIMSRASRISAVTVRDTDIYHCF